MTTRTTLILLVCVLVIGSYIFLVERKKPTTTEREERAKKVFIMNAAEVDVLEIQGRDTIRCEKQNEKWKMVRPYEVDAAEATIDTILSRLELTEATRTLPLMPGAAGEEEKQKYELDSPRLTVRLKKTNGEEVAFRIGIETPLGDNTYLYKEGSSKIYIVSNSIFETCTVTVDEIRSRKIVDFDLYTAHEMAFTYSDGRSITCRKEGELWKITQPFQWRAEHSMVEAVLKDILALRVEQFVTENAPDLSLYGLTQPRLEISVSTYMPDTPKSVLTVGKPVDENAEECFVFRKGGSSVYSVKNEKLERLMELDPEELREKKFVYFRREDIDRIEVRSNQSFSLVKKDGQWKIDGEQPADERSVSSFLEDLFTLEIERFIDETGERLELYGLDSPQLEILLHDQVGKDISLLFGHDTEIGTTSFGRNSEESVITSIDISDIKEILRSGSMRFRDKTVLEIDQDEVNGIQVEGGDLQYSLSKSDNNAWFATSPAGHPVDQDSIEDLLDGLSSLKVQQFIAEGIPEPSRYGLDTPRYTIRLITIRGNAIQETGLVIGAPTPEGDASFARLEGEDLLFTLERALVDTLTRTPLSKLPEKE